jgi:hypothetical protein
MLKNVWGRIPCGFRERPFDVYTAMLLVILGLYGFIDPTFPELQQNTINAIIINVTALYMIVSGMVIITAIFYGNRHPIFSYYGEMYGWTFMASATLTATIFQIYNVLVTESGGATNVFLFWTILFIFFSLTVVAIIRALDMYVNLKGRK